MNISKEVFDSLPLILQDLLEDVEKSRKEYIKDKEDVFRRIDYKQSIYDLSISCKWIRLRSHALDDFWMKLKIIIGGVYNGTSY